VACGVALHSVAGGVAFGAFVGSASFIWAFNRSLSFIAGRELKAETYSNEEQSAARASHSTVRIEAIESGGGDVYESASYNVSEASSKRYAYDTLEVERDVLALACTCNELSKRSLMEVGLTDTTAMSLVSRLLALGYLRREASNMPASWTSKGQALRRALVDNGGRE